MKISKSQLKQIIQEELAQVIKEKTQMAPDPNKPDEKYAYNATVDAYIASLETDEQKEQALAFALGKGYTPEADQYGYETASVTEPTKKTWCEKTVNIGKKIVDPISRAIGGGVDKS